MAATSAIDFRRPPPSVRYASANGALDMARHHRDCHSSVLRRCDLVVTRSFIFARFQVAIGWSGPWPLLGFDSVSGDSQRSTASCLRETRMRLQKDAVAAPLAASGPSAARSTDSKEDAAAAVGTASLRPGCEAPVTLRFFSLSVAATRLREEGDRGSARGSV